LAIDVTGRKPTVRDPLPVVVNDDTPSESGRTPAPERSAGRETTAAEKDDVERTVFSRATIRKENEADGLRRHLAPPRCCWEAAGAPRRGAGRQAAMVNPCPFLVL